ncbi:MAG: tetratricopeptide repeat protein [Methanolobus sp.]|uniref:tetratricopeptide repeat protein n=1 Tax=Methanolobus sp. TaxID=1874737 RepID=UPI00272F882C|nr:tetratricopeptide repeat protein [Methanolobus sp.]MDP2218295.1 tetratricopeptide repeat protein [Methanolobus sp.]
MGMLNEVKSKGKIKAAQNWLKMAENAKTPEKQVEYFTKALDANPYNAEAWFKKGRVLEKMGNFEEAKRCFDLATEIDPDYQGLVGKKQYGSETPADYEENSVFPENRMPEEVSLAEELEEQLEGQPEDEWVAEDPEMSDSAYKPPTGDESIFSTLRAKEHSMPDMDTDFDSESDSDDSDHGKTSLEMSQDAEIPLFTTVHDEEALQVDMDSGTETEDTGTIAVSPTASEADIWKDSSHEGLKEPKTESLDNTGMLSPEKGAKPKKQTKVRTLEGTKPQSPHAGTQPATLSPGKGSLQSMDIRIPVSETLKFWAVGIVAILIAFKIMTYI